MSSKIEQIVAWIVYDGWTEREVATKLGVKPREVRSSLDSAAGQKVLEQALDSKLAIVHKLPMANFATRMKRLEGIYQTCGESEETDTAIQLKTLSMAREEMRIQEGLTEQSNIPQIVVNVTQFKSKQREPDETSYSMAVEAGPGGAGKPGTDTKALSSSAAQEDRSKVEGSEQNTEPQSLQVSTALPDGQVVSFSRRETVRGYPDQPGPAEDRHVEQES
jgi:hypothetical protein